MRIVLDTNVVLSALLWRGAPHRLLNACMTTGVQLYSSPVLLDELAEVLARPALSKRLAVIGVSASQIVAHYLEAVELLEPASVPRVVPSDADDDHVVAAAVAAGADLIVSGDSDLLDLRVCQGIAIVSAATALERIQAEI